MMILQKYSPEWSEWFSTLAGEIARALDGIACTIEHVGSTSVPQLVAKPIIDMDMIYTHPADFDRIKENLEKAGYRHHGDQGIEDREVFKRSGQSTGNVLDRIRHHLYVCPVKSEALQNHLLFRDHLRAHDGARSRYQQLKYELAEQAEQDPKIYAKLKQDQMADFIESIIRDAKRTQ